MKNDWKYYPPKPSGKAWQSARTFAIVVALLMGLLVLIASCTANAADVTLAWDAPDAGTNQPAYRLIWSGDTATIIPSSLVTTNTSATVTNLGIGVWSFQVRTVINGLESDPSNTVLWTNLPPAPRNLRLNLQGAASLDGPWQNITSIVHSVTWITNVPLTFYRGKLEWE